MAGIQKRDNNKKNTKRYILIFSAYTAYSIIQYSTKEEHRKELDDYGSAMIKKGSNKYYIFLGAGNISRFLPRVYF